ncbi:RHS domain-containing protein, partial [Hahella sp. CR1]|uniref:RHS repeat domain-containing protein n=1 Tax=Hahella sp. CR1 TaxID=2992807 RepID=UPI002441EA2F
KSLLPDGGVLSFGYDRHGLFTQVSHNGDVLASIERDQDGRELRRRQGAAESRYDYDVMGRLIRHRVSHRQSKARIIERSYGYDASGNLALIDDLKKGTTHYRYDALDRLKTVEGYCNEEFAFDPAGNILDGQNQAKGNRLNFHGDRHFEYDAAGNLILEKRGKGGKLETRYQYNKQNQLIAIEKDGQKTEYQYDALGRRIAKQDAFGKTEFLWNGDVLLSEQRNHLNKVYVYEPNSFRPLAFIQDKQVYHYHLDHLGTPQEMTNAEGEVVWSARYKAYGNLALQDIEEVQNPLRFQGQYYDEETGLHYNRHRYYDPSAARFINQDPVGLLGGGNNYQYAPNPTGWVDPFGLTCKENSWNQFQKDTKGHFANSTEAAKSYQKMKEVEAMSKPNRPAPSTYLPQSYIDAHIAKFKQEGSAFIAVEGWIRSPLYQNLPPRKFVGLRSEMDQIIEKYEASGKDWRILRDDLALGDVDLSGEKILYVTVSPDDPRFSYDIPDGNEAGAYPNEWVPGGKTKGGATEAALVGSENISHKNSVDELSKSFKNAKRLQ